MAKTRVSHLAKEFNMDVKELILRLREINIEVENYLSSIEGADLARAREMLAKSVPLVEEQRVASNVKRRRTVARPKPAPAPPPVQGEAAPTNGGQPVEAGRAAPATAAPGPPVSKRGVPAPPTLRRRRPAEKPARIISLPEAPKPAPVAEAPPAAPSLTAAPEPAVIPIQEPTAPEPLKIGRASCRERV